VPARKHWGVNFDVRRIWINTDVDISGDITASDASKTPAFERGKDHAGVTFYF